ncbi:carboxypeptidase S1 [Cryphonectria parasitica EP155]|uniref:Carboxypeptidase n=1 Tax=Cryphonectria parasitica (strain ATCC 38755 / EP155) TaxID=660469 RepID=A0A9P5CTV1_CRYP1|nr:carboxypeptidase S1 [Cryphonectria parasitica EP155]KAF3771034.1 carboxypeptidase S1 [Cryphonectria parasitica EP155]
MATLAGLSAAQFPPPREGVTWVRSQHHPGITISYKDPQICETTPGVKSYSGYVHLPPNSINETGETQTYPINTFFWFVEARKDAHRAPLSIWLNGGPGGSSLMGMLSENGPCVIEADSNSSAPNPWAWNNEVNVLFIDQPVQVGFSYDSLNNGTYELLRNNPMESELSGDDEWSPIRLRDLVDGEVPEQNATFYVGTFPSQNLTQTPNSTEHAAVALWHFAQTWFEEFPEYKPHDEKISLWTESYGGHYGPSFMNFFRKQNEKISRGEISGPGTHYLHLDTLGIVNGCIDVEVQDETYSFMAWNNTYGLVAVNETTKHRQLWELFRPGGLKDRAAKCKRLDQLLSAQRSSQAQKKKEEEEHDDNDDEVVDPEYVEAYCRNLTMASQEILIQPYQETQQHGWFDVTHPAGDPFPPNYHLGYLNQQWVQRALGVPVNFTWASGSVSQAFSKHGDMPRGHHLEALADLLDGGVKVHLVYGDRDFACNWIGGEKASLAIPHRHQQAFAAAGYAPLTVAEGPPFVPFGLTRQHGNLSFTRVFQAGHMVPSYQPEASLRIFERALLNRDIATGTVDLTRTGEEEGEKDIFSTVGTRDTWWRRNELLPFEGGRCYILQLMTCSQEDIEALRNGTAVVKDYVLVGVDHQQEQQQQQQQPVGGDTLEEEGQQVMLAVDNEL